MSRPVSWWLEDATDPRSPRPALAADATVDVAIVGAGFTGLWTAYELVQRDPGLQVLVLEAAEVGHGASGRNGAWCSAGIAVSPTELARRFGAEVARTTVRTMRDTVDEVARVCLAEGIDAQFRKGGILRIARGRHELPQLNRQFAALQRLDLADGLALLDAPAVQDRVRVAGAEAALYDPHGAVLHPGRLVHGLAHACERRGVRIVERTPVTRVVPRRGRADATAVAATGTVRAGTVVLACEAWLSQLPGHRRDVLPVYSLIVLTEPLDPQTWERIGWAGHEALSSHRYTVDYLSRTVDGRILFGGRGAPYHLGSRIDPSFDRHGPTHGMLARMLKGWFPQLDGVRVAHAWGGPLGIPRDFLPAFVHDPATGIAAAYGYTGQGVATANLAGRVLADLIATGDTPHRNLPMVGHRPRRWEPEPVRWLAARYLQRALARIDERAARTGQPPSGRHLAERLIRR